MSFFSIVNKKQVFIRDAFIAQAIQLDPKYAKAYYRFARFYHFQLVQLWSHLESSSFIVERHAICKL